MTDEQNKRKNPADYTEEAIDAFYEEKNNRNCPSPWIVIGVTVITVVALWVFRF